jgi:hypothetical protein
MKTKHYTVKGPNGIANIKRDGDLWEVPCHRGCEPQSGTLLIRVAPDGVSCDPMTSGNGADQQEHNIFEVKPGNGPIMGWGFLDDDESYEIANASVPVYIVKKLEEWAGLKTA